MLAPIVLFVYNRPLHTQMTLESLAKNDLIKESILYVYSDGPKENNPESEKLVLQVRALLKTVDFVKEIVVIESEVNKGLADNIIAGVSSVLEKHGKVIVLEDDMLSSPGFLKYMNEALTCYQNNDQVMHISAYFPKTKVKLPETFFYNVTSCWGWGTWSSAWKKFNPNMLELSNELNNQPMLDLRLFNGGQNNLYYNQIVQNLEGQKKTWAIKWHVSVFLNNGYSLHPRYSLISNIGHDGSGENSWSDNPFQQNILAKEIKVKEIPIIENKRAIFAAEEVYQPALKTKISKMIPQYIKEKIRVFSDGKRRAQYLEKRRLYAHPRFLKGESNLLSNSFYFVDAASFLHGFEEIFETEIYKFSTTNPAPLIIDCGSNIGLSVVYFKKLCANAKVLAFEPDQKIAQTLQKNIDSFGLENVELNQKAIWIHNDGVEFQEEGGFSGRIPKEGDIQNIVKVPSVSLKKILEKYDKIDFLKMDIEGAEFEVLKDCKGQLSKIENLFIEYHSHISESQNLHLILAMLTELGFRYHIQEAFVRKQPFFEETTMTNMDLQLNVFANKP